MNETIEIKRSNVLASYEEARKAGANGYMQFLENLFGKELAEYLENQFIDILADFLLIRK